MACSKAKPEPEPLPSMPPIEDRFDAAQSRLQFDFLENGWVVSRNADASPDHQGEGLLWTGEWIGAASCSAGDASEAMLQDMIASRGGALVRFDPLGEYADGRQVTLDGALGLYHGVSERVKRCPDSKAKWYDVLTLHRDFVEANDGRLNPDAGARLEPEFDYVLARLLDHLSGSTFVGHSDDRLDRLMVELSGWVAIVNATHEAGYRAHLALLAIEALENSGDSVPAGQRDLFCSSSRGMGMITLDHWCGRGDLVGWIDSFEYDRWEYRFQRAAWETPDGNGDRTPALDLLVGIRKAYTLSGGR